MSALGISRSAERNDAVRRRRAAHRLATQIGANLTGVLYVLDEPSIGLHQRDNRALLGTLHHLRDLGNTIIVVEHDEETIRVADYLIDLGPGAGEHGGKVIFQGTPEELLAEDGARMSLTRAISSRREGDRTPRGRRPAHEGRSRHPRRPREQPEEHRRRAFRSARSVAITGVSGSGKSTLVNDICIGRLRASCTAPATSPAHTIASRGSSTSTR